MSTLITTLTTASAAAVKVAETKIGESEITTILMSDKLLGPFLLVNLVQLAVWLIRSIWNTEKKKLDEIYQRVAEIPALVSKVNAMDEHLKENVPSHDQVELKILRAINKDRSP